MNHYAQHEPNQIYMEDDCEVAMKLFIIWKLDCPAQHEPNQTFMGNNCDVSIEIYMNGRRP